MNTLAVPSKSAALETLGLFNITVAKSLDDLTLGKLEDGSDRVRTIVRKELDRRVRNWAKAGESQTAIAKRLGQTPQAVSKRFARLGLKSADTRGRPKTVKCEVVTKPSLAEVSNLVGVSPRLVQRAERLIDTAPELAEQVRSGQTTVHAAEKKVAELQLVVNRSATEPEYEDVDAEVVTSDPRLPDLVRQWVALGASIDDILMDVGDNPPMLDVTEHELKCNQATAISLMAFT